MILQESLFSLVVWPHAGGCVWEASIQKEGNKAALWRWMALSTTYNAASVLRGLVDDVGGGRGSVCCVAAFLLVQGRHDVISARRPRCSIC